MEEFITKSYQGYEIIYGICSSRAKDTLFKKYTAIIFYKLMKTLGVNVIFNHADYRILSNKILKYLFEYKETNLFLRGIIPIIGFKSDIVYYEREERFAGESKYLFIKMSNFDLEEITSFICNKYFNKFIFYIFKICRTNNKWMDISGIINLYFWRTTIVTLRYNRRIYRENVF
ncbi:MAG TPA: hypothetical protein DDY85_09345 [Fusobacterium sp.]|jgi:hypothetical protein|nr:hypothetical protein [Fusobacterium sp.]